ncbi:MAG: M17 family peptidase N-terminal domain-containing protein, partial [Dehalococcoidia bacterium]
MEISVVVQDIAKVQADAIVINLFEGTESPAGATGVVDKSLDGIISDLIRQGELKGKFNEISIIHTYGRIPARIVAVVGLGKRDDLTPDRIRIIIAQACRLLRNLNCRRIATVLHGAGEGGMDYRQVTQAIIEGSTLGLYRFRRHMTKEFEDQDINELLIVEREKTRLPELE